MSIVPSPVLYKNITPENVLISSFKTHKTFTFTEADSGSGLYNIPVIKGNDTNLYDFSVDDADTKTISQSVFYKTPIFLSKQMKILKQTLAVRQHGIRNHQSSSFHLIFVALLFQCRANKMQQ